MANKKISELNTRTPSLTDLMLVGDPSTGYSYKATLSALSTLLEANISLNDLNDVTITSPTAGQVLSYNGTAWVNDTNGITGSGTTNYVTKFTSSSAIGNSQIFDNGTNVGIGTISGGAKLEIYDASTNSILRFNSGTNNSLRGLEWYNNNTSNIYGSIKSDYTSGVFTYDAGASVYAGTHVFRIGTGGEAMRIDASGNLGIGTSSPTQSLEVNGSVLVSQGAGNYPRFISTVGAKSWEIGYRSGTTNYEIREDGTTRMVIANGGNVGIGTTSPASLFHVSGGNITLWNSSDAIIQSVKLGALATRITTTSSALTFGVDGSDGSTERMRITSGGNVGIGTSSPASKLLVNLGANDNVAIGSLASIPTGRTMIIQTTSAGGIIETYSSLTSGYVNTLINPNGGNVGIGTTSPDAILRVAGTTKIGEGAAANTSKLMVNTTNGVAAGIQLFQDGVESWVIQNIASSTALTFGNSGTERLRITGGGDVGIGTTTPGTKLEVNGAIKTAAPSGGTAKPFKIGAAATVTPTSQNRTIEIEIDGTTYYLTAKTTND